MQDSAFDDDRLFDRLVDGELSSAERRQLLASLDDQPDGWRRCAVRFLEAQCWTDELRHFINEPATAISHPVPVRDQVRNGTPTAQPRVSWVAIAAGLLIAFTLGIVARNADPPGGAPMVDSRVAQPEASIAEVVPPSAPGSNAAKVDDALTLFVRDETGQTRPLRVPLVDAQALDRRLGLQFRTGMPDEVRSRLEDRGFDIQSKRRYAPLWLEDGRPMFVPVEDTKIVPVRQNVY
jgi:hypothetical protein